MEAIEAVHRNSFGTPCSADPFGPQPLPLMVGLRGGIIGLDWVGGGKSQKNDRPADWLTNDIGRHAMDAAVGRCEHQPVRTQRGAGVPSRRWRKAFAADPRSAQTRLDWGPGENISRQT